MKYFFLHKTETPFLHVYDILSLKINFRVIFHVFTQNQLFLRRFLIADMSRLRSTFIHASIFMPFQWLIVFRCQKQSSSDKALFETQWRCIMFWKIEFFIMGTSLRREKLLGKKKKDGEAEVCLIRIIIIFFRLSWN